MGYTELKKEAVELSEASATQEKSSAVQHQSPQDVASQLRSPSVVSPRSACLVPLPLPFLSHTVETLVAATPLYHSLWIKLVQNLRWTFQIGDINISSF